MIDDARGRIDYDESGDGPTVVFVPGSCSTGAAWRPVINAMNGRFRCVTTSLPGYGGTAERRRADDPSMAHEADAVELVVRRTGAPVHLVGHSFGGLVALAVALRNRVPLASLVILEAPVMEILRECGEDQPYRVFREMTAAYFAAFEAGDRDAVAMMIDLYGGAGTYASWPARVRAYAAETTAVNILDWASAYGFPLRRASLGAVTVPTVVAYGGASHPAVQRANALLGECMPAARSAIIEGAAHFMIATHPEEVARRVADHVRGALAGSAAAEPAVSESRRD
jgi:pimeloyl-ACP methyl ester carboxylesterase